MLYERLNKSFIRRKNMTQLLQQSYLFHCFMFKVLFWYIFYVAFLWCKHFWILYVLQNKCIKYENKKLHIIHWSLIFCIIRFTFTLLNYIFPLLHDENGLMPSCDNAWNIKCFHSATSVISSWDCSRKRTK